MPSRREFMAALACCVPFAATARVSPLPEPQGPVLLTVDGAIQGQNAGQTARFDLAMLDALPQSSFSTSTIWTEGIVTFSGPALMAVLDWLVAEPGLITLKAANEYGIALAPDTVDRDFPILATRKDGKLFPLRESGPIWLVYPFDLDEKFRNDLIYSQSVWQLTQISVTPS